MIRFLNARTMSRFDGVAVGIVAAAWPHLDWVGVAMAAAGSGKMIPLRPGNTSV